jgi:uncharacterized protein (TIGR02646 family)
MFLSKFRQEKQRDPVADEFRPHWRTITLHAYETYGTICAYTAMYIDYATGAVTIDHFRPKTKHPDEAYEWSNYRLCALSINRRKYDHDDVLDPFTIPPNLFKINLSSGKISYRGVRGTEHLESACEATIKRLNLNEDYLVKNRMEYLTRYEKYGDAEELKAKAPIIYEELMYKPPAESNLP